MQGIQPRTLSTQELIRFCADFMYEPNGMPKEWQQELLRRVTAFAPKDDPYSTDTRQGDLFK